MAEKIKLSKPITVGEKTLEEVDLGGLDALTGADIEFCVREADASKAGMVIMFELDADFHAEVAAKVTGLSRKQLRELPAKDYAAIIRPVRSFFAGSE